MKGFAGHGQVWMGLGIPCCDLHAKMPCSLACDEQPRGDMNEQKEMSEGTWMTLVRDADGLNRDANCVDGGKWSDGGSEAHWVAAYKVYEERRGIKVWVFPTE